MKGGEFIGTGTYGCVFYPPIKCIDGQKKKGVGKIFTNKYEQESEEMIGHKIKKIDNKGQYLNIMTDKCNVDPKDLLDNLGDCEHVDETDSHDDLMNKHSQLIYKEKGVDLHKIFKSNYEFNVFDKATSEQIMNLMNGVKLLQKHNLAHMDIKPANILITKTNKLLLIDFGLVTKLNNIYDIYKNEHILEYTYIIYPPEFKMIIALDRILLSYAEHTRDDEKVDTTYYSSLKKRLYTEFRKRREGFSGHVGTINSLKHLINEQYFKDDVELFISTLVDEMNEKKLSHRSSREDIMELFTKRFASKMDVFSIGYVLSLFILKQKHIDSKLNTQKQSLLIELFKKIYCFNPYRRWTIDECIKEFKAICDMKTLVKPTKVEIEHMQSPIRTPPQPKSKPKTNINAQKVDDCMNKYKVKDLHQLIDAHKLDKKLKKLRKQEICNEITKHLNQKVANVSKKKDDNQMSKEKCMKTYNLVEK